VNPAIAASVGVALAATLILAGCTSATAGDPTTTATTGGLASSPRTTTVGRTAGAADNWWQKINSCDLLDQSDAAQLGFMTPGHVYIQSEAENSCAWDSSSVSLQIVLTRQRYDDLTSNGGSVSRLTIENRPGELDAGSGGQGGCDLSLEATQGSRALIIATTNFSTDQACQTAKGVAQAIAPKLPSTSS
jgi:hypothetical protein